MTHMVDLTAPAAFSEERTELSVVDNVPRSHLTT